MKRLFIALTLIAVAFSLNSTHVRSHTGLSDENIRWSYSNNGRSWSGNVEQVFSYLWSDNICRKYTIRKSASNNNGWVEIGLNHNCYCWYSCIDRNTLVLPGDSDQNMRRADGKWCYGKQVKKQASYFLYRSPTMTRGQARDAIRDLCAPATRCQETCS